MPVAHTNVRDEPAAVGVRPLPAHTRRTWLAVCAAVVLLIGGAIGWAVATVLAPAPDKIGSADFTYASVSSGTVERTVTVNARAMYVRGPAARGTASGVVTTIDIMPGAIAKPGKTLFTVGLRPVVVAEGKVPAFRDLTVGDTGADVAQLQRMLASTGFYGGKADGRFDSATKSAVRRWQHALGVEDDGIVRAADVVYLPQLPSRVVLGSDVTVGARLNGGEPVVAPIPNAPQFTLPLSNDQADLVPTGTTVDIRHDGGTWHAVVAAVRADTQPDAPPGSQSGIVAVLKGVGNDPVCGKACDAIPPTGQTLLTAQVNTVPAQSGLVVPTAAIVTSADGATSVVDRAGASHRVAIKVSANGMAVVTGVPEGMKVRVPAGSDPGGPTS